MPDTPQAIGTKIPKEVAAVISLIEENQGNEVGQLLAELVAAFVHPDMVCNLSGIDMFDAPTRSVVREFFVFCINGGVTFQDKQVVFEWLTVFFARRAGGVFR